MIQGEEGKSKKDRRRKRKEEQKREPLALKRRERFTKLAVVLSVVLLIFGGGYLWYRSKTAPSKYDALSQCLTDKGVKMFGAYWCPVCQKQKKSFGNAWRYIKYIECSLPNAAGQTKKCNEAGIESYPTWEFADGKRLTGEIPLKELAKTAGCEAKLPKEE